MVLPPTYHITDQRTIEMEEAKLRAFGANEALIEKYKLLASTPTTTIDASMELKALLNSVGLELLALTQRRGTQKNIKFLIGFRHNLDTHESLLPLRLSFLVRRLVPPREFDDIAESLNELFERERSRSGEKKANKWRRRQAIGITLKYLVENSRAIITRILRLVGR